MNELVKAIREEAKKYEKSSMMLPAELVAVINGRKQESKWEKISVAKVMRYVADMLEE